MSYDIDSDAPVNTKNKVSSSHSSSALSLHSEQTSPSPFSSLMNHLFFNGADRRVLLDEVVHLCQFGNNLVAVIGDKGVGKTAFLYQARYELAETAFCCFIQGAEEVTPEALFSQIVSQLELPVSTVSSAGEMIATLRHAMSEGQMHRVVVIIDDAHALSDGILSALISLLQGHQGQHLHILMSGEKALVNRLDHFEMVDVLVYDVTVNPFTLQETKEYLDFKIRSAGYADEYLIDDEDAESIWKDSGGCVVEINQIAERYLFNQDLGVDDEEGPASGLPFLHMAALVVLLAALILALIYLGDDSSGAGNTSQDANAGGELIQLPLQTNNPEQLDTVVPKQDLGQKQPVENASVPAQPTISPKSENGESQLEINAKQVEAESLTLPSENTSTVAKSENLKPENSKSVSQKAAESSSSVAPPSTTAPVTSAPPVKSTNVGPQKKEALQSDLKQELQKEARALQGASDKKTTSAAVELTSDEKWLMSLNDKHYVLQVIAAGQKSSVEKFINSQPNKSELRMIAVERANKPWYVVIVGSYVDSDEARRAIQSLPQAQVNGGPWPRQVSGLKREIDDFRGK